MLEPSGTAVTAASLRADRAALHRRWYGAGFYQHRDLGTLIDATMTTAPRSELLFETRGHRRQLSLRELAGTGRAVASGLHRAGLRPGDRIVVQLPHSPESFAVLVAALRSGLVTVPVPTAAGDDELAAVLADSAARALFVPDQWRGRTAEQRIGATGSAAALDQVFVVGPDAPPALAFEALTKGPGDARTVVTGPDDVCAILYTSGSTGAPKGVRHSSNSLLAEIRTGWAALSGTAVRRSFVALPSGHVGGLLSALIPLVTGEPAGFLDPWDATAALRLVRDCGATLMGAVPYFLISMLEAAAGDPTRLGDLRYCNVGGAGVPPVLIEQADQLGVRAVRAYGLTEHPTVSNGAADDPLAVRAETDGRLSPGTRARILDRSGADQPPGEVGEIAVVGPEMMLGYTRETDDLAAHLPGGWFRTGDLGVLEPGDLLTVTGRLKDIIIRGGVNIAVSEIEATLMRHPAVADSAVVGVPDPRYGERVLAVVVPARGSSLSLDELRAHFVESGVGAVKTPEHLRVLPELPRGASGKVLRSRLVADWVADPPTSR